MKVPLQYLVLFPASTQSPGPTPLQMHLPVLNQVRMFSRSQNGSHFDAFLLQVNIAAPVPSIAALALHKWLHELRHAVRTDGPGCLRDRVVLVISHWERTSYQTPTPTPARGGPEAASQSSPAEQPSMSQAASSGAGPSSSLGAAASSSIAGGERSTPGQSQKRGGSALPSVAVKLFGTEADAAATRKAVSDMVRGFGLPFR